MPQTEQARTNNTLKVREVTAYATSFPVPPEDRVTLGVGRAIKRDAVVVKVTTECGLTGYGESHHGKVVTVIQPDLPKAGGITEALRIGAIASAHKLQVHLHTSMTGINMVATVHVLAALENNGYFEADVSKNNRFRDELASSPFTLCRDGNVLPLEHPGIGVEVDEDFLRAHPAIEGPAYV